MFQEIVIFLGWEFDSGTNGSDEGNWTFWCNPCCQCITYSNRSN